MTANLNDDGCALNMAGTDWADEPRGVPDQCIRAPKWKVLMVEVASDDPGEALACSEHLGAVAALLRNSHRAVPYLLVRAV